MFGQYYYHASTTPLSGSYAGDDPGTAFADAVIALSPTAWWRLGEASGNALDSSGNSRTLTASGSITYSQAGWPGDGDTAMAFAATSYLRRADEAAWDMGTGDFSVMWAHKVGPGWPTDQQVIGHDGQGTNGEWRVRFSTSEDNIQLYFGDATSGSVSLFIPTTANTLDTGAWVLCVITADRDGNATLYVDGYTEYTGSIAAGSAYDVTNASFLYVAHNNTSGARQYVGSLDEVALWKGTLLSQSQVRGLYDSRNGGGGGGGSTFADLATALAPTAWWRLGEASGTTAADGRGVQDGSYVNTPTLGVAGYATSGNTGVTFASASTEYVDVPDNAAWDVGTADFSIHLALKLASWPGAVQTLFARGNGAGGGDYRINLATVTNRLQFKLVNVSYNFDAGFTMADSAWHAIGLSVDRSGNATMYVDGASIGTADVSAQVATNVTGSRKACIAGESDPSVAAQLNGSLDEVMLWNGTLIAGTDWAALHAARAD
jgi:hypothetical protein